MPFPYKFPITFGRLPNVQALINSEIPELIPESLEIENRIGERSIASFTIIDLEGDDEYQKGQPVEIWDIEDSLIFSGFIDTPQTGRLTPHGDLLHEITCVDNHYLADKRIAAESYENQTAGSIVNDLLTKYCSTEGIAEGEIQTGLTLVQVVINYVRVSEALDVLAEKAGFIWYIDENKQLYFVSRKTYNAPWLIEYPYINPVPILSKANPLYRNRQYIKGGKAVTDLQTETRYGDGTTQTFPLGFPLAKVPTIKEDAVEKTRGIKGIESGKDWYWSKGDNTVYAEVAPGNGVEIEISYYGQWRIISLSTDRAAIIERQTIEGGTGYVDDISDHPEIDTLESAFESGASKLKAYCANANQFIFSTHRSGLKPGQLALINYPLFGFNSKEMLMESVLIRADGNVVIYEVTAIEGPATGSWVKFFKALEQKRPYIDRINIGEEENLIILEQFSETWGWDEDINVSVGVCPIPSSTTYPSTTLFPC